MMTGMTPDGATPLLQPEQGLILGYAPAGRQEALAALLALDARLGGILRGTREPMVGQMRLTWWHEALNRLDGGEPPAEPILIGVAQELLPLGVTGAMLAGMIDGWEALLDDPLDPDALATYAAGRGGRLFAMAGRALGAAGEPLDAAGEGWALVDLADNLSDADLAQAARAMAATRLNVASAVRWSAPVRALGALTHAARMTLERPDRAPGHPLRVARLLRHRLTGR